MTVVPSIIMGVAIVLLILASWKLGKQRVSIECESNTRADRMAKLLIDIDATIKAAQRE